MFDRFADVWLGIPLDGPLTYRIPPSMDVTPGSLVRVPLRGEIEKGVVRSIHTSAPDYEVRDILQAGPVVVTEAQMDLAAWVAEEYFSGPGEAIFKMFPDPPARLSKPASIDHRSIFRPAHDLNDEQAKAYNGILASRSGNLEERIHLIEGITGSGKTEVYIHLIRAILTSGGSALLIVPEISLTVQIQRRLKDVFADEVAVLHSGMKPKDRWNSYKSVLEGQRRIALGTRSAIFAPLNPGIIIIDEEHDGSYKEHSSPRYDARAVAVQIAKKSGSLVVFGSATPRLESRSLKNVHRLKARATGAQMSSAQIIPATESHLSPPLFAAMKEALSKQEKVLLLLNRRGYFPYLYCKSCRKTVQCPKCSVTLPLHRDGNLRCHYCGYSRPDDGKCDRCKSPVKKLGMGTQRMEEVLLSLFPDARIERIDTDNARGEAVQDCISRFLAGEIDILLGTQMIAKGLDSPNVTVVGVLKADQGLAMPDFRSAERTFALLTQVAGRAGRADLPGRVFLEALDPEHPVLLMAQKQDYSHFYETELEDRKAAMYPPFCRLIRLLVRGVDESESERDSVKLGELLAGLPGKSTVVLGPAQAPIYRVNEQYRNHILIKTNDFELVHSALRGILPSFRKSLSKTYLEIDVDPVDLL